MKVETLALHAKSVTPYPISAAPLVNPLPRTLLGTGLTNASEFGHALALDGQEALIWAPTSSGDATFHIFDDQGATWPELFKGLSGPVSPTLGFGSAVALSNGTVAVGAPDEAHDALPGAGAVYVFERAAASWVQQAKLRASTPLANAAFGYAVALDGDRLAVGAPKYHVASSTAVGHAYVFERSAKTWNQSAELTDDADENPSAFGFSISLEADTILVGAPTYDTNGGAITIQLPGAGGALGAAYVFDGGFDGWSMHSKMLYTAGKAGDGFGRAVSLSGERALIGAPGSDTLTTDGGRAYVYQRQGDNWLLEQALLRPLLSPPSAAMPPIAPTLIIILPVGGPRFGSAVSLDGDVALVGAPMADIDAATAAGEAWLFARGVEGWGQAQPLEAPTPQAGANFGSAVSLDSARALIGAPSGSVDGSTTEGVAYVYGLFQQGQTCADDRDCAAGHCTDGVCCNVACDGHCERCDFTSSEGTCTTSPTGTEVSACAPYRCDGGKNLCPELCKINSDCLESHFCSQGSCTPKQVLGTSCGRADACSSGFCSDGLCCDAACDGPCDECQAKGSEGTCSLLAAGEAGSPNCAPFVCDGANATCVARCSGESDCSADHHCEDGMCLANLPDGEACTDGAMCLTALCTDGLCCMSEDCSPYRCGPGGACHTSCGSSAECGSGYQCTSERQCVPVASATDESSGAESGCTIGTGRAAPGESWQAGLMLLLFAGRQRRRSQAVGRRKAL